MSFHELKEFTEVLRSLNFPRLVSNENFRYPNFPLMAEILEWTVRKFEPNIRLPKQLDNEQDRILFVKSIVLSLLQKAHVKLNPKNIYQSDGHAVREILPILKLLYKSLKNQKEGENNREESIQINTLRNQINSKRQDLRQTIQTAGEIPKIGANLFQYLRDEGFSKEMRNKALGKSLNTSKIETEIKEKIQDAEQQIEEFKKRLENITNDEIEVTKKIERRKREAEQLQKRLAKLQSFRPPYMDEYEHYEKELKEKYSVYVTLFRNLHYLKQQLIYEKQAEKEQSINAERTTRIAVEKMKIENEQTAPEIAGIKELNEENTSRSNEIRVFGNMTGTGFSDDEDNEEDEEQNQLIEVDDIEDEEEIDGEEENEFLKEEEEEELNEESEEENTANNF
ncbi:hypothetical protein Mgra_00000782 [Meloidogyne graminicola]|uniref:Clusterin-associated protein 1 n=1 Tax=Meloidogyne graminicola TaxID=189291 RepID=A0A8T0A2S2_9BILA|nr:hypothetical protein Mgra_00000782 [Meloidogyne graminicola]